MKKVVSVILPYLNPLHLYPRAPKINFAVRKRIFFDDESSMRRWVCLVHFLFVTSLLDT